jgi:hypothetical protein
LDNKEKWIIEYLQNKSTLPFVDILDEIFVNAYIDKFDAKFEFKGLGAPSCKELSKLLSLMYKKGFLNRFSHGVRSGLSQDGKFPKWVYSYELIK